MSEQEPLENLWQQQRVDVPSSKKLQVLWLKEKQNQYLFLLLDLFGLCVVPVLFLLLYQELHWFELLWLVLVEMLALAFTVYVIWLRRLALFQRSASTSKYLSLMEKQYQQNIQLVRSTKLVVYAMPVLFTVMFVGAWYFDYYAADYLLNKIGISAVILALILVPIWIWTGKREAAFRQKLVSLKAK